MASVLRTGLRNINPTGLRIGLCKLKPKRCDVAVTQVAGITSRAVRQDRPPRPPPFDWENKKYTFWWQYHVDPMMERFDDNSKVIVIEGMPTVGKDKLARHLAEELEMKYIPPPSFDTLYVNPYGFDLRTLNPKLPVSCHCVDIEYFLKDPKSSNSGAMQVFMFALRCSQYIDALTHVLSTGEGVVLQRTPWTDGAFALAMRKCDYISRGALDYYKTASTIPLEELMWPHLVIYLDSPISAIKDNIKKRNIPYEVNSEALTDEYLLQLEENFRPHLREMNKHCHTLVYDWNKESDYNIVVEDIERLDFETKTNDEKFHDWRWADDDEGKARRYEYATHKDVILSHINVTRFDVPEMCRSAEDNNVLDDILAKVESERYVPGYHPSYDKDLLFKTRLHTDDWLPRDKAKISSTKST